MTEQSTVIITEYKTYDMNIIRNELNGELDAELKVLDAKNQAAKADLNKQIDGYVDLHKDHQELQKINSAGHNARKKILAEIAQDNSDFHNYANAAAEENAGHRTKIADLEAPLRQLQNEVTDLNLDNKNLQLVIDTEAALREAKAQAELSAVTITNVDLKNHSDRLKVDIEEETSKRNEAKRILDDLTQKHNAARVALQKLLSEAEADKSNVVKEIGDFRKSLIDKRGENEDLRSKANDADKTVAQLREAINQLSKDLLALRNRNEEDIKILESVSLSFKIYKPNFYDIGESEKF